MKIGRRGALCYLPMQYIHYCKKFCKTTFNQVGGRSGMASYAIITWDSINNRNKRRVSSTETFDFSSIKIGESGLEIKEVAGALDINGVSVQAHALRHESGGFDEIDGDKLDITIQLSEYTPTIAGTGGLATTTSHLAAHLKGIDNRLAEKLSLSAFKKNIFQLTETDINNGFVILTHKAIEGSIFAAMDRLVVIEGIDFSTSTTVDNRTKIVFDGELTGGGNECLSAGTVLYAQFVAA